MRHLKSNNKLNLNLKSTLKPESKPEPGLNPKLNCAGSPGAPQHEGQGHDSGSGLQLPHGSGQGVLWEGM